MLTPDAREEEICSRGAVLGREVPRRGVVSPSLSAAVVAICAALVGLPTPNIVQACGESTSDAPPPEATSAAPPGAPPEESTKSVPPDTTPYTRPSIPEDYAPGGREAIPDTPREPCSPRGPDRKEGPGGKDVNK